MNEWGKQNLRALMRVKSLQILNDRGADQPGKWSIRAGA
jgi:hypothetical protein